LKIIFFDDINRISDNHLKNFNLGIINNKDKSMKVVILAGGFGTRIAEAAGPKPMVEIGGKPILYHIMKYYEAWGYNEFILALGYKANLIKSTFSKFKFNVTYVDTGLKTMTGGRLKRLKKHLKNERFMLTYGDGVANVDLKKLLNTHIKYKKLATVTAVHPPARFGEIIIKNNKVAEFNEKTKSKSQWINGGFFVFEPEVLDYIKNDNSILEGEPLTKLSKNKNLVAFRHEKFWQCMDTMKDKNFLENLWRKNPPWKIWND
jgi:glucose-1-phosphate cytidylyltransferase